jgi:hypothetical protein
MTTLSSIPFLKTALALWMAATFTPPLLQMNVHPTGIIKASFLKTASLHVLSPSIFSMCIPAGKDLQLMHEYIRLPVQQIWLSQKASTTLPMQDIHLQMNSSLIAAANMGLVSCDLLVSSNRKSLFGNHTSQCDVNVSFSCQASH